ncbi:MAG: hypothetical protein KDD52_10070, partial [Bdellovibrionales bacterium]|nr:hypothetical protein [Bdellovibrionales bacterium]
MRKLMMLGLCGLIVSSCTKAKQCSLPSSVKNQSENAQILATVDGEAITQEQFFAKLTGPAKGEYIKARNDYYEAKSQALEEYIFQSLVEKEAKKRGKKEEEVLTSEID